MRKKQRLRAIRCCFHSYSVCFYKPGTRARLAEPTLMHRENFPKIQGSNIFFVILPNNVDNDHILPLTPTKLIALSLYKNHPASFSPSSYLTPTTQRGPNRTLTPLSKNAILVNRTVYPGFFALDGTALSRTGTIAKWLRRQIRTSSSTICSSLRAQVQILLVSLTFSLAAWSLASPIV